MLRVLALLVLTLLYSANTQAQANEQSPDALVARLSYQSTYGVDWRLQQASPRICFALYRSAHYRMLRLNEQGAETLQGTLSENEVGSLGTMLRRIDSENSPGGIIRQGSESFIAEVSHGRRTVRFLWVDPDHTRPFPDSAVNLVSWLQDFQALGSSPLSLKELGEEPICPTAAKNPFRPLITKFQGPGPVRLRSRGR
jgi:hypothetical protein